MASRQDQRHRAARVARARRRPRSPPRRSSAASSRPPASSGGQMRVPGFRKGKVPPTVVIRRLGREAVLDEALRERARQLVRRRDRRGRDRADRRARARRRRPARGGPAARVLDRDRRAPDAPSSATTRASRSAGASPRSTTRDRRRDRAAARPRSRRSRPSSAPAETGDHVVIDYVGSGRRRAVRGRRGPRPADRARLRPADPRLRGAARRRERRRRAHGRGHVPRRLPGAELAGKDAQFDVTVNEVKAKRLPELDDDFASEAAGFDTLAELREDIADAAPRGRRAAIEREFEDGRARGGGRRGARSRCPTSSFTRGRTSCSSRRCRRSPARASRRTTYLRITGKDEETLAHEAEPEAAAALRREAVLAAIVEAEQIEPTDEDSREALAPAAEREGTTAEKLFEQLRKGGRLDACARTSPPARRSSCWSARPSRSASSRPRRARSCGPRARGSRGRGLRPALDARQLTPPATGSGPTRVRRACRRQAHA